MTGESGRERSTQARCWIQPLFNAVAIIAFGTALALLGVNVKTTVACLGIRGLAMALGAQQTLENIIAGVSLLIDTVVHAGDFCEIGGKLGTVEDIGLRSIRLRTLKQNLLVVPNSMLAQCNSKT